jgi:hypothetical protein
MLIKYVRIVVIFIWIISFLLTIPLLFVRSTSTMEIIEGEFLTYCLEDWQNNLHRQIYDIILYGVQHMMNTMAIAIHNFASRRRLSVRFRRLLSRSPLVRPFLLVICISALNIHHMLDAIFHCQYIFRLPFWYKRLRYFELHTSDWSRPLCDKSYIILFPP